MPYPKCVTYEGESVFAAIDVMRDRWYQHFRLGTIANQLEFGAFGADNGFLLQGFEGVTTDLFQANENSAHISSIRETIDVSGVYNRIVATSGGQGSEAELTIGSTAVGDYPVLSGLNQDGTSYYYIQDNASIAAYGLRTKVVKFPNIRPISNNLVDIQRAKDATKYAAEAYLRQKKEPIYQYSIEVVGIRSNLRVGDQAHVIYRSLAGTNGIPYLSVDDMFYLMDIRYSRDSKGQRRTALTVCTTSQRRTSDQDVIVDVIRDISVLKLHLQPTAFWKESESQDFCGNDWLRLLKRDAKFSVEIDNSITKLTKVRIRFKSRPLAVQGLIGQPSLSPWESAYMIIEGDQHPKEVHLFIDNVDVSVKYGGPWNIRLSGTPGFGWTAGQYQNNALDVKLDITDDILNSPSGLYANHEVRFRAMADPNAFAYIIPGHGVGTSINGDATSGIIVCNIQIQGITQGIQPT